MSGGAPDWSPLGGDPAPGDVRHAQALASDFTSFADAVRQQATLLHGLHDDAAHGGVWQGPAADQALPKLSDLPGELDKVVSSYAKAGQAFDGYARRLDGLQTRAQDALRRAAEAVRQLDAVGDAQHRQDAADRTRTDGVAAGAKPDPAADAAATSAAHQISADRDRWQRQLDQAREDARRVHDDHERSASEAADDLDDASHAGIRNKHGLFASLKRFVHSHAGLLKTIATICNTLSAICGVLAVILPFAAPILAPLALGLGVAGLLIDTALVASGDGSLLDVGMDLLGIATLGTGGPLVRGARVATGAARAGVRAGTRVVTGLGSRASTAVRTTRGAAYLRAGADATRLNKVTNPLRRLRPPSGPRVSPTLPKLSPSEVTSFEDNAYDAVTVRKGDMFPRTMDDGRAGGFYGTTGAADAADAERLSNTAMWGNNSGMKGTFRFKEDTTVYVGKVRGGEGQQILVPGPKPWEAVERTNLAPLAGSDGVKAAEDARRAAGGLHGADRYRVHEPHP